MEIAGMLSDVQQGDERISLPPSNPSTQSQAGALHGHLGVSCAACAAQRQSLSAYLPGMALMIEADGFHMRSQYSRTANQLP